MLVENRSWGNYNNLMSERKVWGEREDKILKYLREERGERKWATIARILEQEFDIPGRSGKQCRERYHNHLDDSIISSEWTEQEEQLLFELHGEMGNKWSLIAMRLPGRADNCVKNHFYSKLRKTIRKLNKIVQQYYGDNLSALRPNVLSQIIEITQSKFKMNSKIDEEVAQFCNGIKNRLFKFKYVDGEPIDHQTLAEAKSLIQDIHSLQRDLNKGHKSTKRENEKAYRTYLKPPTMGKRSSQNSASQQNSEDVFSNLSSSSVVSSCSDLSQYEQRQKKNPPSKSTGPRSQGEFSRENSDRDLGSSDRDYEVHYKKAQRQLQKHDNRQIEIEKDYTPWFGNEQRQIIDMRQFEYKDIFGEIPLLTRILAPAMDEEHNILFPTKFSDDEDIDFKEEQD